MCGLMGAVGPAAYAEEEEFKGLCGVGQRYVIDVSAQTLTISGTGELGASAPWKSHSDIINKGLLSPVSQELAEREYSPEWFFLKSACRAH